MRQNPLCNKGIGILAKAIECSESLVHIDFRSTAFRKEGADKLFKALELNKSVTCLHIGNIKGLHRNLLTGPNIVGIERYLKSTELLTVLDLEGAGIGNEGLYYVLNGLKQTKSVKIVNLACNNIDGEGSLLVLETLRTSAKHLNFSDNPLGNVFTTEFELSTREIPFYTTRLSLSSCNFLSPGVTSLFTALQRGLTLEYLALDNFKYNLKELTSFSSYLLKANTLKTLNITGCFFGDEEVKIIVEGFSSQSHLKLLNLSSNKIDNAGAKILAKKLALLRKLNQLNVSNNSIKVLLTLILE
jgi:Ran GTPase-activating protein (RanGAP) involved in mRNA processing and transport